MVALGMILAGKGGIMRDRRERRKRESSRDDIIEQSVDHGA